jgi:hypothetical protein
MLETASSNPQALYSMEQLNCLLKHELPNTLQVPDYIGTTNFFLP